MSGFGIGIDLGRSQRGARAAAALLAAGAKLLVGGDSLSAQAGNGSQHPLMWAARRGAFDIGYNFRLHNIGVSSSTLDSDAAGVAVTNPVSETVAKGLLNPSRLARDTGYAASTGAKALLLEVGTNSVPNGNPATAFANLQTYVAAMMGAGIERAILGTIQPRMASGSTYMTAVQAQRCRDYNELLRGWARDNPARIHVYDGSDGELDAAQTAEYGPFGGGANSAIGASTFDGIHWGAAHSARRQDELGAVLEQIFPVRANRIYSTAADYSWSTNRYANILGAQAAFAGAGSRNPSTASGGPSGSFGNGWIANSGAAIPAGASVVGTEVTVQYEGAAVPAIRMSFTGTPAATFTLYLQKVAAVPIGGDADNKLRMDGSEKLLHEWIFDLDGLAGCAALILDLGAISNSPTVGGASSGGSAFLPTLSGRYVWREPSVGPVTNAATSCTPRLRFDFKAGQPISGSITLVHAFLGHVA